MMRVGYKQNKRDHTLFIKYFFDGRISIFIIYIDDMIVIMDDNQEKEYLKKRLVKNLKSKNWKDSYFLGIEVAKSEQGIFHSQQKYIMDILK